MVASFFVPGLDAVGITEFSLDSAASCAFGVSINRSLSLCPKTMSGSVYICIYICAISDLSSAIMYLYIYIYMTRAQPSANYILVVVVVCADVTAMGRPTFSSMCGIPAALG